jgi:predicted Zn-dependent protease with MMP-like domain
MDRAEFERLVAEALDGIPHEFARHLENVTILIEDEPSAEQLQSVGLDPRRETLYGLYQGTPLPGRPYDFAGLPDHVTIFARPLMRDYRSADELRRQVQRTVVHEIAHFFGFDERRIRSLGF